MKHSISEQPQNDVWNTEHKEKYSRIENQDPLENNSTSIVPFEFIPISNSNEILSQETDVPMKVKNIVISDQHKKFEYFSAQEIEVDRDPFKCEKISDQDKKFEAISVQEIEMGID